MVKDKLFGMTLAALLVMPGVAVAQNVEAGAKVFNKCHACHQIGETAKNAVGPVLNGIVGRKAGSIANYSYTPANKNSGITWDEATLKEYLKNPRAKVPGTKMTFPGLQSEQDIADVIEYVKQFGPDGKRDLPPTVAEAPPSEGTARNAAPTKPAAAAAPPKPVEINKKPKI